MSGQQQQGGGGGGGDNSLAYMWWTAGLFTLIIIIWNVEASRVAIVTFLFKLKLFEVNLVDRVTTPHYFQAHNLQYVKDYIHSASQVISSVTYEHVYAVSSLVGRSFNYPVAAFIFIMAIVVYLRNPTLRFKKTYDMQKLLEQECANWPQVSPVIHLDLVNEDLEKGPWAMGTTPMDFAKKHKLLDVKKHKRSPDELSRDAGLYDATVARGRVAQVMAQQLGPQWKGPQQLKPYMRALLAIFMARINSERKESTALLLQIAASSGAGRLDFTGADKLLDKYKDSAPVKEVVGRHRYLYTVFPSLLEVARNDGVLATSEFLWLKPVDRKLWYILNSVGRRVSWAEVAGIFAHWKVEQALRRPLYFPMVEEAVNAMEKAIAELIYEPTEEEKKRLEEQDEVTY